MALATQTEVGHAIPPAPRHAITVHLPLWSNLVRWTEGDVEVMNSIKSMYPRMMLHRDVKDLAEKVLAKAGCPEGQACLLFSNLGAAAACEAFAISKTKDKEALSAGEVTIRIWQSCVRLYAVFFPASRRSIIQPFWTHTGTGISSRLAEACLNCLDNLHEVAEKNVDANIPRILAHQQLEDRIVHFLERAPAGPPHSTPVSSDDVYLFPTGMAANYAVHTSLLDKHNGRTVLFGFMFRSSYYLFENFGPGCDLLGRGTAQELAELESNLQELDKAGRCGEMQALWTEFPANPMLSSADLAALRKLADKYHFALIVDDTVGSFCNVDVLGVADILVTSVTKSFSGYADVMGGSVVLNPSSMRYTEFKAMLDQRYCNDYWSGDAKTLEHNSRDYLSRSRILNSNAERLAFVLDRSASDPESTIAKVFYPAVNSDRALYESFIRQKTTDFTPGYGCLFTIELESIEAAIAFYDSLPVYKGPHLGAHLTLAMPYVKGLYGKQLAWAAKYGLKEAQIRISVGLEDIELLLDAFKTAVQAADATKGTSVRND